MTTDAPERLWLWGKDDGSWLLIDRGCLAPDTATQYVRADLPRPQDAARIAEMEAENARLRDEARELKRQLGGGCEANHGGDHTVIRQGRYSFCALCGESLRGVRFCHEPPAALAADSGAADA